MSVALGHHLHTHTHAHTHTHTNVADTRTHMRTHNPLSPPLSRKSPASIGEIKVLNLDIIQQTSCRLNTIGLLIGGLAGGGRLQGNPVSEVLITFLH